LAAGYVCKAAARLQGLGTNEAVVVRLLAGMCDAVVRLRSDFAIEQHSPQLAALLLRAPCVKGLEGVPFQDLLHEDERSAFCERLADSAKAFSTSENIDATPHTKVSCSMPGSMRDSSGNRVPVQLVYTSLQDLNQEICHVIGIREDSVEEQLAPMPMRSRSSAFKSVSSAWEAGMVKSHESEASEAASNAGSAALSVQPEVASEASIAFSEAVDTSFDAVVWVDVGTKKLTVARSSVGFNALCGPSHHCTELLPLVAREQRLRFKEWVKSSVEAQTRGQNPVTQSEGLILQPRHLRQYRISARAVVVLKREMEAPSSGAPAENIWHVQLSNIEWIHGRVSKAAAPPMETYKCRLLSAAAGSSRSASNEGPAGLGETSAI